eukprot:scaffold1645_cov16-Tisochrysis_lutea.AAC.1
MAGASGPVPFHAWGQWPTQSTGMHRSQAWRFQRVATPGRRWGSVIDECHHSAAVKQRKTRQVVKKLPTSIKDKGIPRAKAPCISFTKRKRKKLMGITRVTSSCPCLILVVRGERSLLKGVSGPRKFICVPLSTSLISLVFFLNKLSRQHASSPFLQFNESGFRRCMKADYGGIFISLPVREPDIGMHGLVACLFVPFLTCRDPTDT